MKNYETGKTAKEKVQETHLVTEAYTFAHTRIP